jgi:hypothetical protein
MNIAYFIYIGKYIKDDMFDVCIQSLRKVSNCKIVVYTTKLENEELLKSRGASVIHIDEKLWIDRKMTCKIECASTLPIQFNLNHNDNVMCFDADLIFLKDPFSVFENKFDFFYTTRHYDAPYKANGGVWGYKHNQNSEIFLKHYVSNLNKPTWEPYLNFRKNHTHNRDLNNKDWWVDQDWLCVCNEYKNYINNGALGFSITLYDAGPNYNWIIRNGVSEVLEKIDKRDKHILHLKGSTFTRWTDDSVKTSDSIYKKYINLIT